MTIAFSDYPAPVQLDQLDWANSLKERFRFQVDRSTIRFWQPSAPLPLKDVSPNWFKAHQTISELARLCHDATPVDDLLEPATDFVRIHLLVTAEKLEDVPPGGDGEGKDRVPELIPLNVLHSHFRGREISFPAPSTAATSKEYAKLQKDSRTAVYDGFYARKQTQQPAVITAAPPIQIFHRVFQEFSDRINDRSFEPNKEVVSAVSQLLLLTTEIRPSEEDALDELRPLLGELLGVCVEPTISAGTRSPDGMSFKMFSKYRVPLLCLEYKRTLGEGKCSPSTQAAYSLREFLILKEFKKVFEKCCCPSFILAGGGPHLSILGVIYTDKLIVQQLAEVWAGAAAVHRNSQIHRISQIFGSLRLAMASLDKYYDKVSKAQDIPPLVLNKPHPRFFPYPTKFQEHKASHSTTFEYIDIPSAAPTNVTFIAKADSLKKKLVIKFVEQYGVRAHELLAREGMAPKLYYCGLLDGQHDIRASGSAAQGKVTSSGLYVGPLLMVIMEHIEGHTMDKAPALPGDAYQRTKDAMEKLHEAGLVFGDLRTPNIMVSEGKVFLIDFDWAGKEGEARYPLCLSGSVKWPEEAKDLDLELITKDHDKFMFNQLRHQ